MIHSLKEIEFIYPLSAELEDRLRVLAVKQKRKVIKFVVQYEAIIDDEWRAIVRYDTSHGFAHKDMLHHKQKEDKQPLYFFNFNIAFTFAIQDLKIGWRQYRTAYEKELEEG